MGDRRERRKKTLGIAEYAWSSEEDDDDDNMGAFQQSSGSSAPNPAPDISVIPTSQPSTSSAPNPALPSTSSGIDHRHLSSRQSRGQLTEAQRQDFWSMLFKNRPTVDHNNRPRSLESVRRSPQPVITSARPPRRASPLREIRGVLAIKRNVRAPNRSGWSNGPPSHLPRGSGRGYRSNPLFTPAPPRSPAAAAADRAAARDSPGAAGPSAGSSVGPLALRMIMRAGLGGHYGEYERMRRVSTLTLLRPSPAPAPAPAPPPPRPVADEALYDSLMDSDEVDTDVTMPPADTAEVSASGSVEMRLEEEVVAAAPPAEAPPEPPGEARGSAHTGNTVCVAPAARADSGEESRSSNVKGDGELNQSLLRLLECPVCLEWMEPPMCQCRRGHLVCVACRARLTSCPVCRTAFSSVRNRAMEGVAETLRYPCRHGCGNSTRLRRRASHEASCARRRVACPAPACARQQPVAMQEMQRHVQSKHPEMLRSGRAHDFPLRVNAESHDHFLVAAMQESFHVRIDVSMHTWDVSVYVAYMGPKINAGKYEYQVTIEGKHNAKKLVYTRATHSDLESATVNISRQDCFYLSMDQALNFMRLKSPPSEPENPLNIHVEISANTRDVCGEDGGAGEPGGS